MREPDIARERHDAKRSVLPEHYPWAYEMKVTDPDGHVLRFGSEPKEPA